MFATLRWRIAALFVGVLASLLFAGPALAQPSQRHPSRLSALRQQNAFLQQQNAVQAAVQQTTVLVQSNYQQNYAASTMLQQQQSALQIALQQTRALLQTSNRKNTALTQTAQRQLNTLQTALQQTIAVQNALSSLTGPQVARQLRTLFQQQSALIGLLASPSPLLMRSTSGR